MSRIVLTVDGVTVYDNGAAVPSPQVVITPPPPPPPPALGVTYSDAFTMNAEKKVFTLYPGQVAAVSFVPAAGERIQLQTTETTGTPDDADHMICVSETAGDFSKPWPYSASANYVGTAINAFAGAGAPWQALLTPGRTYFLNLKLTGTPSHACPIRVQIQRA